MLVLYLGCEVHAYDYTAAKSVLEVGRRPETADRGLHIHKKFIGGSVSARYTTIEAELERNGHVGRRITYMKARERVRETEREKERVATVPRPMSKHPFFFEDMLNL